MVVFSILLEKCGEEYYYRYISENITYYIPSYKTDRLNRAVSDYENVEGYTYSENVSNFLNKVYEEGECAETHKVKDIKNSKELSITIAGYRYNNYLIIVGGHKSDTLLEDTLFKEDYIFLIRWLESKEELIDDISDNVIHLLEYSKEEILSKSYIDFIHPEDKNNFKEELSNYIKLNTTSFYQKYRLLSKSNKPITVLDHSCQIVKEDKKSIIGYLRDITIESQMSNKLKELISLDESNFNNSILIKIEWDKEFNVTRWNPEARDVLGWDEDIIGKNIRDIELFSDEDSIKMQGQFKRLFAHEVDNVISSFRVKKKDGGLINVKWSNKLIFRDSEPRIFSSVVDQSQEALLTVRLDEMENRTDLLLKTLSETKMSNDVFSKLIHNPLTANPEGLIKAEIIIRKLEEELTRLNNTIFYNNDNNLLNDVALLKNEERDLKDKLARLEENNRKLADQLDNLLNINVLSFYKNLDFKGVATFIIIGYMIFGQMLPAIYPTIIRPWYIQINKELRQVGGKD